MSEYVYATNGTPVSNTDGEISLPRERIIRCRDCKHYEPDGEPHAIYSDRHWCEELANYFESGFFCAWGKRVEG